MALNIKNPHVVRLAEEVARLTGESKTEAIRRALVERRERLSLSISPEERRARLRRFLEREIWPQVPDSVLGSRLSREREEEILGYGEPGA